MTSQITTSPQIVPDIPLRTGHRIPLVGLGTSRLRGLEAREAVAHALAAGYRLVDTAAQYANEASVGAGIRDSGVPRDQVVVTTKIAGGDQGYAPTRRAIEDSLRRLGLDYIDVLLVHWPNPSRGLAAPTWQAILEAVDRGQVVSPGVSNFLPDQIRGLVDRFGVWPAVNQIQVSPALPHREALAFHRAHDIVTEAWGPLGLRNGLLEEPALRRVAQRLGRAPAQVALRWGVEQGIVVIPRSTRPEHQRQNADLFGFALTDRDRADLAALERDPAEAWDPLTHEEW